MNKKFKKVLPVLGATPIILIVLTMTLMIAIIGGVTGDDSSSPSPSDDINIGNLTGEQYEWVCNVLEGVILAQTEDNVYICPSICLVMGIQESTFGTSTLAKNTNNCWGINKGGPNTIKQGWDGAVSSNGRYKKYSSVANGARNFCNLVSSYGIANNDKDYKTILLNVLNHGYCEGEVGTSSTYYKNCTGMIDKYNLTVFDNVSVSDLDAIKNRTYGKSNNVSINNCVYYNQMEEPWKSTYYYYNGPKTLGRSGCGPTTMAMVMATLTGDTNINPKLVGDWAIANNVASGNHDLPSKYAGANNRAYTRGSSLSTLKSALQQGYMVVFTISKSKTYNYHGSGHFICLYNLNGDTVNVLDSASRSNTSRTWKLSDFNDCYKGWHCGIK